MTRTAIEGTPQVVNNPAIVMANAFPAGNACNPGEFNLVTKKFVGSGWAVGEDLGFWVQFYG